MSQQLNPTGSENQKSTVSKSARPLRLVLGVFLWTSALAMGYFVWQASRQMRETMNARAQAPTSQIPADMATSAPAGAAVSKTPSTASLWDQSGVQDFTFTERSGRKVTKADLLGHPWLISFIFTRCAGPCPKVSGRMSDLQRLLAGTDVKLVTLTVDPDFDKPDVLNRYAQSFGADANRWLYLTGDKAKTYRLINESFKMPVKEMTGPNREPGYEVLHSVNILRVNEKGVVVAKYNALDDVDVARLGHDLAPEIIKAKANRAKSPASAPGPASTAVKGTSN
ncbi:MAG TPA: SCO family protein [Planctomycetaceae bacterium]|jgi:cytochrome oxidase Cu insertion factor (SCO1/SenC/PrrC family)|nr:SCO family protein [Planctomycetaceae bacterium]